MVTLTYQERFKTLRGVFDSFTERTLFSLQSKGAFDELVSPLEVGKESNVFIAVKDGKKVIVKIYRMQNCDFNQMYDYIRKDPRYEFLKKQRRSIIIAWTQREYKNLLKAEKAKISSPKAISWKNHIVVEEFIGDENAAPQLKDTIPLDPEKFFEKIIVQLKNLFDAGLIHGDLSAFNILNHHNKPVLIDFSQATLTKTPNSPELLKRDIKNLLQFFRKLGIHKDEEKVFKRITERE
ncbi:MAG: serine protein kinase RIO [archaeon]|nr:serine protein kinase RIO [archaeon]